MAHTDTSRCPERELHSQVEFASHQHKENSPVTEFKQATAKKFFLEFYNRTLRMPDGLEVKFWSFESETSGRGLPAPLIRVNEGDIMQCLLQPAKRVHTIHWHGIEPDPRNDGVGHTSFEVTEAYTYQWQAQVGEAGNPNKGAAGSYFYHCHVNTVLHVQMGMFGALIVDPPSGRGRSFNDGPEYNLETETLLGTFGLDPRWHTLEHEAGLNGEDVGLNRFEPTHFYALGGNLNTPPRRDQVSVCREIRARLDGKPTLVRLLNGGYMPVTITFEGLTAEVIAHDGRPLRDTSNPVGPCPPVRAETDRLVFGAAQRYDVLLKPTQPGRFNAKLEWRHWITGKVLGTVNVPIVVE